MDIKTDVIIIGAGPTGLALAAQLIRLGVDFVILDKKEGTTDLSKALIVHARTLEIYDQIGLAQKAVEQGTILNQAFLHINSETRTKLDFSDFGKDLSPFPFVLVLEQSKNEKLLYEFLQENEKEVLWNTELESLTQTEFGVSGRIKNQNAEIQEFSARYIVGCDGAGSTTRHLLNIGFGGKTDARAFYVADVEMKTELGHNDLHLFFGDDAFVIIAPMKGENHWRLIGNLHNFEDQNEKEIIIKEVENKVKSAAKLDVSFSNVFWFSTYKIHTRHAENFQSGKAFLVGDAAHIHTPAGGQGMNTGIQDAYNLAWKLAFVLKQKSDETLLESYEEERLENAKRLLRTTDELFELNTSQEWYLKFFRERILLNIAPYALKLQTVKHYIFPLISQIGISYDQDVLSRHLPHEDFKIKAGNRFPYFRLDGKNIFELISAPRCHLILFTDSNTDFSEVENLVNEKYAEFIDVIKVPLYSHIAGIFGSKESFTVFVRPDNYIGYITKEDPINSLNLYLTENLKFI